MSYRFFFFFVLTVLPGVLSAQSPHYLPGRDPFSGEIHTRLGTFRRGEIPDTLQFQNPRLPHSSLGKYNHWVGADPELKSARFRPLTKPPQLPPSYLQENVDERTRSAAASNPAAVPQRQSEKITPAVVPTEPNFFERAGVMTGVTDEPATPGAEPAYPGEKRWFRDLNGLDNPKGGQSKKATLFQGDAVSFGNELLPQVPVVQPEASKKTPSVNPAVQAAALRQFEQKLATMLASNPSVQFLSPIRISYQNGRVTVQGVVPNQTQKIAAGNALLGDPAVKQVHNLITVLPDDSSQVLPPIEPK